MLKTKIGFIPSNWESWDGPLADGSKWATKMRDRCVKVLETIPGIDLVVPSVKLTGDGCVSNIEAAKKTLEFFKKNDIRGLIIGNMTFGMEVAVSTVLNGLQKDIPILHFCTRSGPIEPGPLGGHRTTDTWCGQFMTTSALRRRGFKFKHILTCNPEEEAFKEQAETFIMAVNAMSTFKNIRIGQIGTRPDLFESQVVNEQLLQCRFGQMVVPIEQDLLFSYVENMKDNDPAVKELIKEISRDVKMVDKTAEALTNIAKYELSIKKLVKEFDLRAVAVSCWTRVQARLHISSCSTFGRLNEQGIITACEVDIMGGLTMWLMYNAALRKNVPDFIDWTDLHPTEPNVWLAWHCGNAAPCLKDKNCCQPVLGRNERMIQWDPNCFGTLEFKLKSGPVTCARLVEYDGEFNMFIGSGEIIDIEPAIRGAYGWVKVKDVGDFEQKLIDSGTVHHGCLIHNPKVAAALEMACYFIGINCFKS